MKPILSRIFLLCLSFAALNPKGSAQTLTADLQRMYETMLNAKSLWMEFEATTYISGESPSILKGWMKTYGTQQRMEFFGMHMCTSKDMQVMVDNQDKSILLRRPTEMPKPEEVLKQLTPGLEQNKEALEKAEHVTHANGMKGYAFRQSSQMFSSIELYFDEATGLIKQVTYFYNSEITGDGTERLDVKFTRLELNPSFSDDIFSPSQFVVKANGVWKATPAYAGYSVESEIQ
jgi:outer membrane lipoprotein-sorting protein